MKSTMRVHTLYLNGELNREQNFLDSSSNLRNPSYCVHPDVKPYLELHKNLPTKIIYQNCGTRIYLVVLAKYELITGMYPSQSKSKWI